MKTIPALLALFLAASTVGATVLVEDWVKLGKDNAGTFADTTGSSLAYKVVEGPQKGQKAVELTGDQAENGYCGFWTSHSLSLTGAAALVFMAKCDKPGSFLLSLTDANKVRYVATVSLTSPDWTQVTLGLDAFEADPFYQAEGADKSKPMDLSKVLALGVTPLGHGPLRATLGPLSILQASASASGDAPKAAPAQGVTLVLQDFSVVQDGLGGGWKDEKGSAITLTQKPAPKKDAPDDRTLNVTYHLVAGGWCGFWYRAGDSQNWDGVDFSKGKALVMKAFTEKPIQIGFAAEDGNKLKFDGAFPLSSGGRWENLVLPLDGLSPDFGAVKTFNVYMKTPGDCSFAIDRIAVVK